MVKKTIYVVLLLCFLFVISCSNEVKEISDAPTGAVVTQPDSEMVKGDKNEVTTISNVEEEVIEPEVIEEEEEEIVEEQVEDESVATETESLNTESQLQTESNEHIIKILNEEFLPEEITISVGDTVVFKNMRDDFRAEDAFIIGLKTCRSMKSTVFSPGEEYSYTFTEEIECDYSDGIRTKQGGTIIVE